MAKKSLMKIASDERLNDALKNEVQELRGAICSNIKNETDKFTIEHSDEAPEIIITNLENGNKATAPLYAAKAVMNVLEKLF